MCCLLPESWGVLDILENGKNRGDRRGENTGRWKWEMQKWWERTGVCWKNTERWEVDRGVGGAKKGEPGGHKKAEYNSSEKCLCVLVSNFKSEKCFGTILFKDNGPGAVR